MIRWPVLVTRAIPEEGLAKVRERCEMVLNPHDRVMAKEDILAGIKGKDGLLCLLTDTIDEEIMAESKQLRVISNYAVGFNNIDIEAASRRQIIVTNTPGVLTESTADFAFALLMAAARRIPEGDRLTRAGRFEGWGPMLLLGGDVFGRTLGIVGMGRIGKAVAARAEGFSMPVLYHQRTRLPSDEEREIGASYVCLEDLLRKSDFVSLHVPLTPETHHLIGARQLAMMRNGAYLINTSRGPVVDESALAEALAARQIGGAALDVYEREPEVHPALLLLDNVILAPHIASATLATRSRMAVMAADNLIDGLSGKIPAHVVNPALLKGKSQCL
jgi:glyoxylate reductase